MTATFLFVVTFVFLSVLIGAVIYIIRHQIARAKVSHLPGYSQLFPSVIAGLLPKWLYDARLRSIVQEFNQSVVTDSTEYGPVFRRTLGTRTIVIITDPDFGKLISTKGSSLLPKSHISEKIMVEVMGENVFSASDEAEWKRHRLLLNPAFTDNSLHVVATHTVPAVQELLGEFEKNNVRDVSEDMANLTLNVISKSGFGYSGPTSEITQQTERFFHSFPFYFILPEIVRKNISIGALRTMKDSMGYFKKLILDIIRERRNKIKNEELENYQYRDILSLLLAGVKDEEHSDNNTSELAPLSNDELIANSFIMIVAGHETTARTMAFSLYALCMNPDIQARAQAHVDQVLQGRTPTYEDVEKLSYINYLFLETLRHYPVAVGIVRLPRKDIEFKGYRIPKGTPIMYHWAASFKDPKYWVEPEKFSPERFDPSSPMHNPKAKQHFSPFGLGNRICLGKKFAHIEASIAMAMILQKYSVSLKDPQYRLETEVMVTMRPSSRLEITFEKRK